MDMMEAIRERHSVRQYTDREIEPDKREILEKEIGKINAESGLHIQIIFDEPKCFDTGMAHYGSFSGVKNYISLAGKNRRNWKNAVDIMENSWCFLPRPWD